MLNRDRIIYHIFDTDETKVRLFELGPKAELVACCSNWKYVAQRIAMIYGLDEYKVNLIVRDQDPRRLVEDVEDVTITRLRDGHQLNRVDISSMETPTIGKPDSFNVVVFCEPYERAEECAKKYTELPCPMCVLN